MLLSAGLLALGLTACGAAGAVNPAASPAAPAPTALPDENAPEISEPTVSVEPYSDLRYLPWLDDYAKQTYQPEEYNASDLYTYTYNTGTAFAGAEDEAAALLEECKDPGLGVRSLQARGITGRGVNVAILDQPLLTDHPEFADRIAAYYDTGCEGETGSMHGPAVASLLAGKTIGVAPDANIYYAAWPSWLEDSRYAADALDWVLEQNEALPEGEKIRVRLMPYPAVLDPNARDDPAACRVGFPGEDGSSVFAKNALALPCSYRTTAEEYTAGQFGYTHYGQGGMSWGIPYCAGVMALGWQVDPTLTGDEIMRYLLSTAATGTDGNSIIDPVHFVETLETNRST